MRPGAARWIVMSATTVGIVVLAWWLFGGGGRQPDGSGMQRSQTGSSQGAGVPPKPEGLETNREPSSSIMPQSDQPKVLQQSPPPAPPFALDPLDYGHELIARIAEEDEHVFSRLVNYPPFNVTGQRLPQDLIAEILVTTEGDRGRIKGMYKNIMSTTQAVAKRSFESGKSEAMQQVPPKAGSEDNVPELVFPPKENVSEMQSIFSTGGPPRLVRTNWGDDVALDTLRYEARVTMEQFVNSVRDTIASAAKK